MSNLALVGCAIYTSPADPPVSGGVVVIEDDRIAAVGPEAQVRAPQGATVIDCTGCTVTAGFWNCHVHFFERKWANAGAIPGAELQRQLQDSLTRYGFTSVFDLSSEWWNTRLIRQRIESGEVAGPRIRSTGAGLIPPGGLPPDMVMHMMGSMKVAMPEVADAGQASAAVRKLLDDGVDGIKLFGSSPRRAPLTEDIFEAAVRTAHGGGKPVFVHPNNAADVRTAVAGGVDVIAHTTPNSGPWDDALLDAMLARGVALTPTLALWKYFARHDRLSAQEKIIDTELGQLRAWIARGGAVLFGTDLGAVDPDPSEEYRLMAAAGMGFPEILAALTTAPAERFEERGKLGRILPGWQADLVVLAGDPARDLRALSAVKYTLRAGKPI